MNLFTPIRNQKGILTLDLVFALSLTLGGMIIVFALALSLTAVEVAQYVAFSTSRAYYAGHVSLQKQEALAQYKFTELEAKPAIKALYRPGWFEPLKYLGARNYQSDYQEVLQGSHSPMEGTEIQVKAKLLSFDVPFFGRTTESEDGLQTRVNSYLGREPTAQECLQTTRQRWQHIKQNVNLGGFNIGDGGYYTISDNGC